MRIRRHQTIIALLVASVFLYLFSSCGVPTYLIPDSDKITRTSNLLNEISFTVNYKASSVDPSKDHVGLLLLYYIGDSTNDAGPTVINSFTAKYRPSIYDAYPVSISDNAELYTVTVGGMDYNVYAFEIDGSHVNAPDYTDGHTGVSSIYSYDLTYDDTYRTLVLDDGSSTKTLTLFDGFPPLDTSYIHVFGAISVQSPNYSNIYLSKLQYIGPISL